MKEEYNSVNINSDKIEISMTKEALFNYMMINSTKGLGILVWISSVVALILLPYSIYIRDLRLMAVLGVIIYLNLIVKPLQYKSNAANQLLNNEAFRHPMGYNFNEEGVLMTQHSGEALVLWDEFIKVENRKKLLLLYVTKEQAFIIIKSQVSKEKFKDIQSIISDVPHFKHNFKR